MRSTISCQPYHPNNLSHIIRRITVSRFYGSRNF